MCIRSASRPRLCPALASPLLPFCLPVASSVVCVCWGDVCVCGGGAGREVTIDQTVRKKFQARRAPSISGLPCRCPAGQGYGSQQEASMLRLDPSLSHGPHLLVHSG